MSNTIITNNNLVDTCDFPSIRFGIYYTSQLANDVVTETNQGADITHPGPSNYNDVITSAGATVNNNHIYNMENVVSLNDATGAVIIQERTDRSYGAFTESITGGTVVSTFGGIASEIPSQVILTSTGGSVVGKNCY